MCANSSSDASFTMSSLDNSSSMLVLLLQEPSTAVAVLPYDVYVLGRTVDFVGVSISSALSVQVRGTLS